MASKMNSGFMDMIAKKKDMAGKKDKMPMKKSDDSMMAPASPMGMKKGGKTVKKMASGGLAGGHKSADGIATKGKTKGKQVTMKSGGSC